MKTYLDCLPCFLTQALRTGRITTADEKVQREIMDQVMEKLVGLPLDVTPPQIARMVYGTIITVTGNRDPFAAIKKRENELALDLYPEMKAMVRDADDPLLLAVKLAIAGNIIDMAIQREIRNIREEILAIVSSPLTVNDEALLRESLTMARQVLYLGDNAGEIVFDRILIEELSAADAPRIVFAVRGEPIINDVTIDDARAVGLDRHADIMSSGSCAPATVLPECSAEFVRLFRSADVIIAKGQGNYESLSDEGENLFFLLTVKCPVVARHLGLQVGDRVLKSNRRQQERTGQQL